VWEKRRKECERLHNLIEKENPQLTDSVFEKPANFTRENPFYKALKAQKDERSKYKLMIEYAIENGQSV